MPTLNLGHKKRVEIGNIKQASQRGQRAKEQEGRECVLAEEIAAMELKLNEVGEQISVISFDKEVPNCVDSSTEIEEFDYLVAGVPPLQPFYKDEFWNDKKVNFYTGLPLLDMLKAVFL